MTDLVPVTAHPSSVNDEVAVWDLLERQAVALSKAGDLVPKAYQDRPQAILAVGLAGRRFGWDVMTAMRMMHSIGGRPGLNAEAVGALIRAAGHRLDITRTVDVVTVTGTRVDGSTYTATWTRERASAVPYTEWVGQQGNRTKRETNLLAKWEATGTVDYMLVHRAIAEVGRFLFPDVTLGIAIDDVDDRWPPPTHSSSTTTTPETAPPTIAGDAFDADTDDEEPVDAEIVDEPAAAHPADNADANAWIDHARSHGVGLPHLRTAPGRPDGRPVGKTRWTDYPALDVEVRRHVWDWVTTHTLTVGDTGGAADPEPAQQYALGEEPF